MRNAIASPVSATYSSPSTVPVTLSYLGISLTIGVPPVGAVVLGALMIGGALYTAYRLATRNQPAITGGNGIDVIGTERRGLFLLIAG